MLQIAQGSSCINEHLFLLCDHCGQSLIVYLGLEYLAPQYSLLTSHLLQSRRQPLSLICFQFPDELLKLALFRFAQPPGQFSRA